MPPIQKLLYTKVIFHYPKIRLWFNFCENETIAKRQRTYLKYNYTLRCCIFCKCDFND